MTKEELIKKINNIVEFLTNGIVHVNDRTFNGHPAFYLIHSIEEFEKELNSVIVSKDSYDKYDLYYYSNYMIKYMLNQYDSHTKISFINSKRLPIKIRFIDDIPYIVDCIDAIDKYKGTSIIKINGFDINNIIKEMEKIICYASNDYLKIVLEEYLSNPNIIKSLPIMNKKDIIVITTDKGDISFDLNRLDMYEDKLIKQNYNLEIIGKTAIITYNSCKEKQKMIELIDKLNGMNNIENYIVDLRGNYGGDSSINKYLVNYLKGKKIIVLCDERVFSSARMCLIDLKKIGAKIIGSNPGTPISCFGNCVMQLNIDDMNLRVTGSATYWYYDENFNCHGIYKENFDEALSHNPNLLILVFFNVDEKVKLTLNDYINHSDSVLDYALFTLKDEKTKTCHI